MAKEATDPDEERQRRRVLVEEYHIIDIATATGVWGAAVETSSDNSLERRE
jgi:hypothetical protein